MISRDNGAQRRGIYEERRNPYLVDYEEQRGDRRFHVQKAAYARPNTYGSQREREDAGNRIISMKTHEEARLSRQTSGTAARGVHSAASHRSGQTKEAYYTAEYTGEQAAFSRSAGKQRSRAERGTTENQEMPVRVRRAGTENQEMPVRVRRAGTENQEMPVRVRRAGTGYQETHRRDSAARRAAIARRKKRVMIQRLTVSVWLLCILVLAVVLVIRNNRVEAATENNGSVFSGNAQGELQNRSGSGTMVQGLPADVYAAHPEWTEDFLTPNEYSRPGDALETVDNIFVHYTANPGTSAAQNRSYFEQQKDVHEASVSAHFIIGYEGEIIQCVPLDEIAYAVMTRNYDSISIECCYKDQDGSFTQETYDSLVSLLAWLTDAYGLDSEDILRHYDCGGKKCPLYYTEHEDAWEQLKKDVDRL